MRREGRGEEWEEKGEGREGRERKRENSTSTAHLMSIIILNIFTVAAANIEKGQGKNLLQFTSHNNSWLIFIGKQLPI